MNHISRWRLQAVLGVCSHHHCCVCCCGVWLLQASWPIRLCSCYHRVGAERCVLGAQHIVVAGCRGLQAVPAAAPNVELCTVVAASALQQFQLLRESFKVPVCVFELHLCRGAAIDVCGIIHHTVARLCFRQEWMPSTSAQSTTVLSSVAITSALSGQSQAGLTSNDFQMHQLHQMAHDPAQPLNLALMSVLILSCLTSSIHTQRQTAIMVGISVYLQAAAAAEAILPHLHHVLVHAHRHGVHGSFQGFQPLFLRCNLSLDCRCCSHCWQGALGGWDCELCVNVAQCCRAVQLV